MNPASGRVLVVTNMWPGNGRHAGVFVEQQVEALREAAPDWRFDVLEIANRRGRRDYLFAVSRVRAAARRGYDVIHAHYGLTGGTVVMARTGVPMVLTLHGSDVHIPWQRRVSRFAARRAAAVLTASAAMQASLGVEGTLVVPCGVRMTLHQPLERATARARLGLAEDALVLLFPAARRNPVKDHALFLAAVERLPASLRARVLTLALEGLAPADVPLHYAAADAVVLTSRAEGSPMVVKEALACGRPVVGVDVGDVATLLAGVPGCVVTQRDAAALARAIEQVIAAAGGSAADSERRRQRILDLSLDDGAVARRLLGVYRGVLGRSS